MPKIIRFENVNDDVGIFFQRQLEHIKAKTYDVLYPEYKAKILFPVDNEGGPGVEFIRYYQYDKTGDFVPIDFIGEDVPLVEVKGKEFMVPAKYFVGAFRYNVQELNAAKFSNVPLSQQKANAVRAAYEKTVNRIAFFGYPELNIKGFFELYVHNKVKRAAKGFTKMTPDEIVAYINSLRNRVYTTTLMVERPNCLVMDPNHLSYISSMRLGTASDTTILEFIVEKCAWLEKKLENVVDVNEFVGNSEKVGEAPGDDVIAVYRRDPEKIQLSIPAELTYRSVQERGFFYYTPAWGSIAGIEAYYPKGIQFGVIPKEDEDMVQEMEVSDIKEVANPLKGKKS
jgi:hypothetical protein